MADVSKKKDELPDDVKRDTYTAGREPGLHMKGLFPPPEDPVERAVEKLGMLAIRGACDARTCAAWGHAEVKAFWSEEARKILRESGLLSSLDKPEGQREAILRAVYDTPLLHTGQYGTSSGEHRMHLKDAERITDAVLSGGGSR